MPIPESVLGPWSHHYSGQASRQAHLSIRGALDAYRGWAKGTKYDVFLQGSYKNDTNLRRDSDVDVVVQLAAKLRPRVAALNGAQLRQSQEHMVAYERWRLFRRQVLKALRSTFETKRVTPGRKSLKLSKGQIPAAADVVVTLRHGNGIAFYLPDEHRWVVSYPQQHHARGQNKERGTSGQYKRTIRMFKAARNQLVERGAISSKTASSYFIECMLYNVPDRLFGKELRRAYCDIVSWLARADLQQFRCQNGVQVLFGKGRDQWHVQNAQTFIKGLAWLWDNWP